MSAATPAAKISGHAAGMGTSGDRANEPKPKKNLGALWRTRSASDWIIDGIIALIIAAIVLAILYPMWFIIVASFSDPNLVSTGKVTVLPKGINFKGYLKISGVQYKVIKEGNGPMPKDTSMVKVNYEGRTIEGKVFDSSYKRGEPLELRANQVIKGWTDALVHMPVGSVWEVYIPQELAYGEREQGDIKPFSALIFKIELISAGK